MHKVLQSSDPVARVEHMLLAGKVNLKRALQCLEKTMALERNPLEDPDHFLGSLAAVVFCSYNATKGIDGAAGGLDVKTAGDHTCPQAAQRGRERFDLEPPTKCDP
ncbi:UNVERIFIED_CONTAM: hypothetical protein FKN15_067571 [Acipenser sinensis]